MKTVAVLAVALAATLAPPAHGDEVPVLPEIAACLEMYPEAVLVGQETLGVVDTVCLEFDQGVPAQAEAGDTYVLVPPGLPEFIPELVGPEPVPTGLMPPKELAAFSVSARTAKVVWSPAPAPLEPPMAAFARTVPVVKYLAKCEGSKARTSRTKVKLHARRGDVCKVRAINANGVSSWSQKVRVKRR